MNQRPRLWQCLATALIIMLAVAVTWGFAVGWCGYLASQIWGSRVTVSESLRVLPDGTPIVVTYSYGTVIDQSYRTLDGQPTALPGDLQVLTGVFYARPNQSNNVFGAPITWPERIAASSTNQRPPTAWYLIRDAEPVGHVYLVGYDEASRLPVGYIGRNGFRPTLPPKEEWFNIGRNRFRGGNEVVCSAGNLEFGGRPNTWPISVGELQLPPWQLYLIDGDRLQEIDLQARTVRSLLELPGMLAVGVVEEPPAPNEAANAAPTNPPAGAAGALAARPNRQPLPQRVAIRLADRVVIFNPRTVTKRETVLPESFRNRQFTIYAVNDDQLILVWWNDESTIRGKTELAWVMPDGSVSRERSVVLAWPPEPSKRAKTWDMAAMGPVPVAWLLGSFIAAPVGLIESNEAANYPDALSKTFALAWPPLLAVLAVSAMLTWVTYRSQRKYRRSATGVWTAFVLLLGLPGFIAYLLEHRRAKLESCNTCDEIVPRDREACAACDAQFPTPPLVGTEVFV